MGEQVVNKYIISRSRIKAITYKHGKIISVKSKRIRKKKNKILKVVYKLL